MKELTGGLWFAGLLGWALLGLVPGLVCILLGAGAGMYTYIHELEKEEQAASCIKSYPPYGY